MPARTDEKDETTAEPKTEAPSGQSGFKAWLPLIITLVLMPAVAYGLTMYVLVPKIQKAIGTQKVEAREAATTEASEEGGHGAQKQSGKPKSKVALTKIIVNVSGSLGTRLLLASFTLAGDSPDFKAKIEDNTDQLRDLAASALSSKTIADLEKPEARNLIRTELLSQFNTILGANTIQEIYITEFAIQ